MRTMTAEFCKPSHAEKFHAALTADITKWFIEPGTLRIDGLVVTWKTDARFDEDPAICIMDMRQTIAYYGSTWRNMASLNGRACLPA